MILSPSMKFGYQYFKISVDFEYKNEIYNIIAEPFNTVLELKEIICKKIFPFPKNIHCFYKNIDLYGKEEEQISMLFPLKKKIKIKLKKTSKEKKMIGSYKNFKSLSNLFNTNRINLGNELFSDSYLKVKKNNFISNNNNIYESINNKNNKTVIKKRLLSNSTLDNKKKSNDNFNSLGDDYFKNNELLNFLHRNQIIGSKPFNENLSKHNKINEKNETKSIFNTDIKLRKRLKKIDKLAFNIKEHKNTINNDNNDNNDNDNNLISNDNSLSNTEKEEAKVNKKITKENFNKNEYNNEINEEINKDNSYNNSDSDNSYNNKKNSKKSSKKSSNNNINDNESNKNKKIEDINYMCSLCKNNIITDYCLNCNHFICKNCTEKCKLENHETFNIKIEDKCINNINSYGQQIKSNIEKKVNTIKEYDKKLSFFDIKKRRDNLIEMLNEIINLYSKIMNILKNIYNEKDIKVTIEKYQIDSDKIKEEINEILKKADLYIKSDPNNNTPKFNNLNLKYFFNLINGKIQNHNLLTEKMQVYSLNSNINTNIEKTFNEIEKLMEKISNKENPFELKDQLKNEYDRLIKEHTNLNLSKEKKKVIPRRRTVAIDKMDLSRIKIPNFPTIKLAEKNNE